MRQGKERPKNELDDVSDALEKLFDEHIVPTLAIPTTGKLQPRLPMPDEFRVAVCYSKEMSTCLHRLAPSLRVLFAGPGQGSNPDRIPNPAVRPARAL